jgi:hypothetical protein
MIAPSLLEVKPLHGHTRRERRLEDQRAPVLKVDSVAALRP